MKLKKKANVARRVRRTLVRVNYPDRPDRGRDAHC